MFRNLFVSVFSISLFCTNTLVSSQARVFGYAEMQPVSSLPAVFSKMVERSVGANVTQVTGSIVHTCIDGDRDGFLFLVNDGIDSGNGGRIIVFGSDQETKRMEISTVAFDGFYTDVGLGCGSKYCAIFIKRFFIKWCVVKRNHDGVLEAVR